MSLISSVIEWQVVFATDLSSPKSSTLVSPSQQQKLTRLLSADDEAGASSLPAARAVEPLTCILMQFCFL